jgi:hypothetical protein
MIKEQRRNISPLFQKKRKKEEKNKEHNIVPKDPSLQRKRASNNIQDPGHVGFLLSLN